MKYIYIYLLCIGAVCYASRPFKVPEEGSVIISKGTTEVDNKSIKYNKAELMSLLDRRGEVSSKLIQDTVKRSGRVEYDKGNHKFPETLHLIEFLIPHADADLVHKAWLHHRAAYLLRMEERYKEAYDHCSSANEALRYAENIVIMNRMENLVEMGVLAQEMGDRDSADLNYSFAKRYRFWLLGAKGETRRRIFIAHGTAIKGLIAVRIDDAEALKRIKLIPATKVFQERIDARVRDLEEKVKEVAPVVQEKGVIAPR